MIRPAAKSSSPLLQIHSLDPRDASKPAPPAPPTLVHTHTTSLYPLHTALCCRAGFVLSFSNLLVKAACGDRRDAFSLRTDVDGHNQKRETEGCLCVFQLVSWFCERKTPKS